MTDLETVVPPPDAELDEGIIHTRCCAAPELALCGVGLDDAELATDDGPVCVVCDQMELAGEPCPKWGRCVEEPGVLS